MAIMFKNLRIGTKLYLGFGILVGLFVLIGFVSWSKMNQVTDRATSLAVEYVPEVEVAAGLERAAHRAQADIESYCLSREGKDLESGRAYLAEMRKRLEEAGSLGEKHENLARLRENTPKARKALEEYEAQLERALGLMNELDLALKGAGEAGDSYMALANGFLSAQNEQMALEIEAGASAFVLKDRLGKINRATGIISLGNRTRVSTLQSMNARDPEHLKLALKELDGLASKLDELAAITGNPDRLALLEEIRGSGQGYIGAVEHFRESWFELDRAFDSLGERAAEVMAAAGAVIDGGVTETGHIADFTVAAVRSTLGVIMIVISLAAVIGTAVAFVIARMITRPLKTVVSLSERAGTGDLTLTREEFDYDGRDELGQMADALAAMITAQRKAVTGIIEEVGVTVNSAESLAALSEEANASLQEVNSAVEHVSELSESNSAALEETDAGIQEVSTSATTAAQASASGASASGKTIEVAQRAVGQVNAVIDDIHVVESKSEEAVTTISDLARSVEAISGFVVTITGIADQTNLLALNAAIEAARAGDAGRGFAVVADEVRKLAEESNRAAREVSDLIATLQDGAQKAITVTDESGTIMKKTVVGATEAQEQLDVALQEIAKINDVMQNIAAGAEEQAAAAEQMAAGVDQVSSATVQVVEMVSNIRDNSEETARASEGVANHAQSLAEGAERMQEHLACFKVDRGFAQTRV